MTVDTTKYVSVSLFNISRCF